MELSAKSYNSLKNILMSLMNERSQYLGLHHTLTLSLRNKF